MGFSELKKTSAYMTCDKVYIFLIRGWQNTGEALGNVRMLGPLGF